MSSGKEFLYGSATGIGTMPHEDVAAALKLIKEYMPSGPHWPQLPKLGTEEGFSRQYLAPLINLNILGLKEGEAPFFYNLEEDWPEREQAFYELYLESQESLQSKERVMEFFAFPRNGARGFYAFLEEGRSFQAAKPLFVKGQVSGPLSIGLQVSSGDGKAAFYDNSLRDILVKNLALHARFFRSEPFRHFYFRWLFLLMSRLYFHLANRHMLHFQPQIFPQPWRKLFPLFRKREVLQAFTVVQGSTGLFFLIFPLMW